ncbi:TPM domain-containing protein [Clostridiaceae bacterium OttesenSCG-928-D20]|nr:TPM domain-containing protein [Clostridiaceae bacterium OttesenSCG-928-D20]
MKRATSFLMLAAILFSVSLAAFAVGEDNIVDNADVLSEETRELVEILNKELNAVVPGARAVVVVDDYLDVNTQSYTRAEQLYESHGLTENTNGVLIYLITEQHRGYMICGNSVIKELLRSRSTDFYLDTYLWPLVDIDEYDNGVRTLLTAFIDNVNPEALAADSDDQPINPTEPVKEQTSPIIPVEEQYPDADIDDLPEDFGDFSDNFEDSGLKTLITSFIISAVLPSVVVFIAVIFLVGRVRKMNSGYSRQKAKEQFSRRFDQIKEEVKSTVVDRQNDIRQPEKPPTYQAPQSYEAPQSHEKAESYERPPETAREPEPIRQEAYAQKVETPKADFQKKYDKKEKPKRRHKGWLTKDNLEVDDFSNYRSSSRDYDD